MSEEKEIMNTPEINPADQDGISNDQTEKIDSASTKNDEGKEDQEEEYMDILGNGTVMKKVVEQGSGNNIMMGEKVTIELQRTIPEMEKEFPSEQVTFTVGDCDVEQALDLAVALMKLREKAIIVSGYKYMFGEIGLEPDIPPRANFKLDVHVIANHGFPDYNKMDLDERFSEAKKKKEKGNFYFRRKEYSQAVFVYSKANKIVDPDEGCVYPEAVPEKLQELLEFRGVTLANTSVAQLKVGAADAAIKSALEATKLCPAYSKAYFRLGQAYEGKGNIDEAIKAHKLALKNDPENSKIIHNELSRLTKLNKAAKQSQQEMYSKMFWGAKPPNVSDPQKGKVKDDSSLNAPPPVHQHRPTSPTPFTCSSLDPRFVFNNPMFEAGIEAGKQSLAAGRSFEDTVAMASSSLQKMSSREVNDPEELMRMAGQMAAVNPPEVDAVLRKSFEERMKSLPEEELARAQSEIFKVGPHDLQNLLKREVDGMNDQLVYNTAGAPEKDEGNGLFNQQSDPSAAIQREIAATADVTQEGNVLEGPSSALSNCDEEAATVTLSDVTQEMSNTTGQASIEDIAISHISTKMCAQDAILEKESLSLGERASTFEYPTQDIVHIGQERIVQADTSEMNESKAYKEDCKTSHDDSFHVDSLLERDKQVTSVVQQAGLSTPATGDYNLVEERGSDQGRGNAYVEINQVYAKMNYFSCSTDVDTGDTYPEEIIELNVTPAQNIVEVNNEEKKVIIPLGYLATSSKESLSFGERASTFEYPTQDIVHIGQERIVQADTSEMNESKAYKEDCKTSHDDSFHVDSLLERDKQVTSVVQQAGLSTPATGDYNLVEERGSDQGRGNAYVEINQVYAKMNYFSCSTDVDTGDTYPEEIIELNVTPAQDIVEVNNEEKKVIIPLGYLATSSKESLSFGERASTFEYPTQDIVHIGQERIVQADTSEMNESKAYKEDCKTSHDDSFHVDSLLERDKQVTSVVQQAGLSTPATGDYNLVEERGSDQGRGNAYVEINQVYAKMNYFSCSTDVDTGDTYPEEIIELNVTPAQDIVEVNDEEKKVIIPLGYLATSSKESLSFGERASTFEYPTQDIVHIGQERIVQADTSEMNESKAYKEDCKTSHDDSFHVDSLLERDKQVTSVVQQAGLSTPATGDYNLVEERGSDQGRGNAYVEINQVYAKMNYFSWSTDVDTGDTYPEEIIELNVTPAQDIVEVNNEEKKYSWLTNPMLLGTIGVGLAGVGMGLYRYLNSH